MNRSSNRWKTTSIFLLRRVRDILHVCECLTQTILFVGLSVERAIIPLTHCVARRSVCLMSVQQVSVWSISMSMLFKSNLRPRNLKVLTHLVCGERRIHTTISKMVQAKKFVYAKRFNGLPKLTDFRLEEETLPVLRDGGKYTLIFSPSIVRNS